MRMSTKSKPMGSRLLFSLFILVLTVSMLTPALAAADYTEEVLKAKQTITGRMLVSHIHFLASRFCQGREPGTPGMEVADQYIKSTLSGIGITPAGEFGSFFQDVKINEVSLNKAVKFKVEKNSAGVRQVTNAQLNWEFLPVILSAETGVTAPLVFAGYGITSPEHKYDDYKSINAAGKIVLVMRHEPGEKDADSPFDGVKTSTHGTLLTKILNAQKHGAVGIVFVTDPMNHDHQAIKGGDYSAGAYWPVFRKESLKDHEDYKFMQFKPRLVLDGDDYGVKIPVVLVSGKLVTRILGNKSLKSIQEKIDKTMQPQSFTVSGTKVTMDVSFKKRRLPAHNIVAKLEGSDPELKKEYVILGAHYDHVGKDLRGRVFGGADDNASGTSAVIELMRAFKSLKKAPKRSILFILFTAEEKGLMGAHYYSLHPLVPIEKSVAMYNLDMIGRNDVSQLSVLGKYQNPNLFKILDKANKSSVNFEFNFNAESSIARSDQFPFLRKGIPSIFLNSGFHDQYHRPEDTVGRIIPDKIERVAQLAFLALWDTANQPAGTSFKK